MKKSIFVIAALAPIFSAQAQTLQTNSGGKMTTGLSIALIIVLALLLYTLMQKGKLHKHNLSLQQRIKELENK